MIVVDASVLVPALLDDGHDGDTVRARLRGERLSAPELIDLELTQAWRRIYRAGELPPRRLQQAFADLESLPMQRASHGPLLGRIWELRDNLSAYDAAYAVLAELLEVPLLTADQGIARASGVRCQVELLG